MTQRNRPSPSETAADPCGAVHLSINVPFEYPVHFTRGVLDGDNTLLADTLDRLGEGKIHRVLAVVDAGLVGAQDGLIRRLKEYAHTHRGRMELVSEPMVVPGGPAAKTDWQGVRDIMTAVGDTHLDRQSTVLAIGGGSVLDMAGFAASVVHRGVRLVRVCSTVLAQADAGIGVKNGMDEHGQKNFVGTFAPPFAVINDFDLLDSLPRIHWQGGLAEAFKVAIIKDADLLNLLCEKAGDLRARDRDVMARVVRRTAEIHISHLLSGGDPFEFGSARPLDFGHWAGHRLEILSGHEIGHGQAVAVGIALDVCYATEKGMLTPGERDLILDALEATGLPTFDAHLTDRAGQTLAVLEGLDHFREHLGGQLTITLPDGLGRRVEVHSMDAECIADCIAWLEERHLCCRDSS